jgi:hypothetical protein
MSIMSKIKKDCNYKKIYIKEEKERESRGE